MKDPKTEAGGETKTGEDSDARAPRLAQLDVQPLNWPQKNVSNFDACNQSHINKDSEMCMNMQANLFRVGSIH